MTTPSARGLYAIPLGVVNAFLLIDDDLTLIDTGYSGNAEKILRFVDQLGHGPGDIRRIVLTHAHPDHIGSAFALKTATQAEIIAHRADAPLIAQGHGFRPLKSPPDLLTATMLPFFFRPTMKTQGVVVDTTLSGGEELIPGLRVIHTPGHTAGHISLLWERHGGVLFVGDACVNLLGLEWGVGYEDVAVGRHSLEILSQKGFEMACFGHGPTIRRGASEKFAKRWLHGDQLPYHGKAEVVREPQDLAPASGPTPPAAETDALPGPPGGTV